MKNQFEFLHFNISIEFNVRTKISIKYLKIYIEH